MAGICLEEEEDDAPATTTETVESPAASQSMEPITSTVAAETADDWFDFAGDGSATPKGTAVASASGSGTDDLLHGLTIPEDAATTATAAAVSTGADDMFGGMNMSGGGATSSTMATVSTTNGVPIEISSAAVTENDDYRVVSTSGPSGDLSGLLGVTTTTAAPNSGSTTQMSDQNILGLNSGGNQPSSVSSSSDGFGFVSAASMTAPPVLGGGMPGGMPGGLTGIDVHPTPEFAAYEYPGSVGGGAAAMMGAVGMRMHQTGGMAHHHQVPAYGQPGMMMQGGGMPGGMMGSMMGASPAMGRMSMMTQPPASHPLFSGGGSMSGVTAAGSTGMGLYGMRSGSRMAAPYPFATSGNQQSTSVSSSSGGFGSVSAASMTSMAAHLPLVCGGNGYPGSAGGGTAAAAMMGEMTHHNQAPGFRPTEMMKQAGGKPGRVMGGMSGASAAMSGTSIISQPPASHPMFTGVTAAGMGSHVKGSKRRRSDMEEETKEQEETKKRKNPWMKLNDNVEFLEVKRGSGRSASDGDLVMVRYVTKLESGEIAGSKQVYAFEIGGMEKKGFETAVKNMKLNSKRNVRVRSPNCSVPADRIIFMIEMMAIVTPSA